MSHAHFAVIVAREGVNTLNQFDFVANPRHDTVMGQSLRPIGGWFAHASLLQVFPYLKATRLFPILLVSGAEYGYCGKPIDPQRDIFGHTDGHGYRHYGCYMLHGSPLDTKKPPPKSPDES